MSCGPLVAALLAVTACKDEPAPPSPDARPPDRAVPKPDARPPDRLPPDAPPPKGWVVAYEERFETTSLGSPSWTPDPVPDDGPFADHGAYFKDVTPPKAYRLSQPIGDGGWLTVESYSRSETTLYGSLVSLVEDPSQPGNKVLRLSSPAHTDATVIRSTQPLPSRYRLSLRVGHASFGDGKPGLNGYTGGETAEPWSSADETAENGFYWLAILDAVPRPHNNVWIHHHRKLVVDSDNHHPPWLEIWDGTKFVASGEHPVMLFALDGKGQGDEQTGKPFLSYAAGEWQPSGEIRAVDAYKEKTWYTVTLTREGDKLTVTLSGDFAFGGPARTYSAELDAAARCVFHYNLGALAASSPCVDTDHYPSLDASQPHWPAGSAYPDYFMLGDPHSNYYEGQVLYDDLKLEVWRD